MQKNLNLSHAHIRRDYHSDELVEKKFKAHPMKQFSIWFDEAILKKHPDANAFILATADRLGRPSARVLLMKGYDKKGITFFTNYSSEKGKQLAQNPHGEAVFFWNLLNRQVRLRGAIRRLSRTQSLTYFNSRPLDAQIAACISKQSCAIKGRKELQKKFDLFKKNTKSIGPQMPFGWGGYILEVHRVEFWQGRPNRLHDRLSYLRSSSGAWKKIRLQP